jgi:protein-disulfide isomerase
MWSPTCRSGWPGRLRSAGYNFLMKKLTFCSALVALTACTSSAQQARRPTQTDVVATVGSRSITLAEVDDKALEAPTANFGGKLSQALYDARRGALEEIIASALMDEAAKADGIDRAALVEKEITSKVTAVNDAEVAAWYQANQARVQGAPLDQVRQPIRGFLTQERMQKQRARYIDELKSKTNVRILLDPPRQKVKMVSNSPSRGPADAPIQIVEFSDFQCPFCFRVGPSLKQVFDTYGDRIHLVYREYPLPNHPNAKPASEAGLCANEQGKFWPFHDRLFASQQRLGGSDLKQHAADLGLDAARFNACVDSHKYADQVEADIRAGNEAGVNGTPAFFINGRLLSGAQPFEEFKKIIDDELAQKKK